jgi:peptide/nickel transport system substrate-binding protein
MGYIPDLPERGFDPERAKQLLANAGYANGFKAKLIPCPTSVDRDEVVLVQNYLKKVGIDIDIDFVDAAAFRKIRYQAGWNNGMLIFGTVGHPNFAHVMNVFCSQRGITSHTSYVSEEFANALDAALGTLEMEPEKMQKVNRLAVEGLFQVPVHTQPGGPEPVVQANVHDHGLLKQQEHLFMSSEACWLSK